MRKLARATLLASCASLALAAAIRAQEVPDAACVEGCEAEHALCRARVLDPLENLTDRASCQEAYLRCLGERRDSERPLFGCMERRSDCERRQAEEVEEKRAARLLRCDERLASCTRYCPSASAR